MRRNIAIVAVVALALALTACFPGASPDGEPGESSPATAAVAAELSTILEDAGIAIAASVDDDDAFDDAAVVLLSEQVEVMAAGVGAGEGTTGSQLDGLFAVDAGLPPMAYILAGWAREWDGAGAEAARDILPADIDWEQPNLIVWPDAALALFLADITADLEPGSYGVALAPAEEVATALRASETMVRTASLTVPAVNIGALCTAGADFIQKALATVFGAIEAAAQAAESGIGGFLGRIVGIGIRWFGELVHGVVDVVEGIASELVAPLKDGLVAIAILQQLGSLLQPWTVRLSGDPAAITTGPNEQFAKVKATVSSSVPDFPDWIRECAKAIKIDLPKPPGPGAAVEWDFEAPSPDWAQFEQADGIVSETGALSLTYHVNAEAPEFWGGDPIAGYMLLTTLVPQRTEIETLNGFVGKLIAGELSKVPAVVRGVVNDLVAKLRTSVVEQLTKLLTPGRSSTLVVPMTRHGLKEEKGKLKPVPDPAAYAFCVAYAAYGDWEKKYWPKIAKYLFTTENVLNPNAAFDKAKKIAGPPANALYNAAPPYLRPLVAAGFLYADASGVTSVNDILAASGGILSAQKQLNAWTKQHCGADIQQRIKAWYARYKIPY